MVNQLRGSLVCDFCHIEPTVAAVGGFDREGKGKVWSACSGCQEQLEIEKQKFLTEGRALGVVILRELEPRKKELR